MFFCVVSNKFRTCKVHRYILYRWLDISPISCKLKCMMANSWSFLLASYVMDESGRGAAPSTDCITRSLTSTIYLTNEGTNLLYQIK